MVTYFLPHGYTTFGWRARSGVDGVGAAGGARIGTGSEPLGASMGGRGSSVDGRIIPPLPSDAPGGDAGKRGGGCAEGGGGAKGREAASPALWEEDTSSIGSCGSWLRELDTMRVTKPPGRVGGRIPRGIVVAWIWCGSVVSALTSPDAACFGARSFSDRFFPKMTMCASLRKGVGSGDKASLSEANDYAAPLAEDRNVSPDRRRACKASPADGEARRFHGHACAYQNIGDIYGVWSESGANAHSGRARPPTCHVVHR